MYYASKNDGFLGYPKHTVFTVSGYATKEDQVTGYMVAALPWEGDTYGRVEVTDPLTVEQFNEELAELSDEHPLFRDMLSDISRHDLMKDGNDTIYTCYGWMFVFGDRPRLEVHELDEPNVTWMKPTFIDPMEVNRFSKENASEEELLSIQLANFVGLPEPDR